MLILVQNETRGVFFGPYPKNFFSLEEFSDSQMVSNFIESSNLVQDSLNSNIKNENVISNTLSTTTTTEATTKTTTNSNGYNYTNSYNHSYTRRPINYSVHGEYRNLNYEKQTKINENLNRFNKVKSMNLVRKGSNSNITNINNFDNEAKRMNRFFKNKILNKNLILNSLNSSVDNSNSIRNDFG